MTGITELAKGIRLQRERRMRGGKTLDGKIWLELDGRGRVELTPDQAFQLAAGIFHNLGISVEFGAPPVMVS